MIDWLVQSSVELHGGQPDAVELPPTELLDPVEAGCFTALKNAKRRRDWLLGRWTAKRLLQAFLYSRTGELFPLQQIGIGSDTDRAPYARLVDGTRQLRLPLSLSISHSEAIAFCALLAGGGQVGADVERIAARPSGFAAAYFTPLEAASIDAVDEAQRAWLTTAIWSAKEAALKALRLGLSVDTRTVACRFPLLAAAPNEWTPFAVDADLQRDAAPQQLQGWLRVQGGFAFSLAVCRPAAGSAEPTGVSYVQ